MTKLAGSESEQYNFLSLKQEDIELEKKNLLLFIQSKKKIDDYSFAEETLASMKSIMTNSFDIMFESNLTCNKPFVYMEKEKKYLHLKGVIDTPQYLKEILKEINLAIKDKKRKHISPFLVNFLIPFILKSLNRQDEDIKPTILNKLAKLFLIFADQESINLIKNYFEENKESKAAKLMANHFVYKTLINSKKMTKEIIKLNDFLVDLNMVDPSFKPPKKSTSLLNFLHISIKTDIGVRFFLKLLQCCGKKKLLKIRLNDRNLNKKQEHALSALYLYRPIFRVNKEWHCQTIHSGILDFLNFIKTYHTYIAEEKIEENLGILNGFVFDKDMIFYLCKDFDPLKNLIGFYNHVVCKIKFNYPTFWHAAIISKFPCNDLIQHLMEKKADEDTKIFFNSIKEELLSVIRLNKDDVNNEHKNTIESLLVHIDTQLNELDKIIHFEKNVQKNKDIFKKACCELHKNDDYRNLTVDEINFVNVYIDLFYIENINFEKLMKTFLNAISSIKSMNKDVTIKKLMRGKTAFISHFSTSINRKDFDDAANKLVAFVKKNKLTSFELSLFGIDSDFSNIDLNQFLRNTGLLLSEAEKSNVFLEKKNELIKGNIDSISVNPGEIDSTLFAYSEATRLRIQNKATKKAMKNEKKGIAPRSDINCKKDYSMYEYYLYNL